MTAAFPTPSLAAQVAELKRDRPILFSAMMVRALLDGRKSQTRRILKPQPSSACAGFQKVFAEPPYFEAMDAAGRPLESAFPSSPGCVTPYPSVRFAKGMRLWVRETWQTIALDPSTTLCAYRANCDGDRFTYADDGSVEIIQIRKWRPAIFMPRLMSRLTLTVTDVRVQRLQEIRDDDAKAEGAREHLDIPVATRGPYGKPNRWSMENSPASTDHCLSSPRWAFANYWEKLNGEASWNANPWIIAVSFTVERRNIDATLERLAADTQRSET